MEGDVIVSTFRALPLTDPIDPIHPASRVRSSVSTGGQLDDPEQVGSDSAKDSRSNDEDGRIRWTARAAWRRSARP